VPFAVLVLKPELGCTLAYRGRICESRVPDGKQTHEEHTGQQSKQVHD